MNWKSLLFFLATVASADLCPRNDQQSCPDNADSNFFFVAENGGWKWESGTLPGVTIDNNGNVAWNPVSRHPLGSVCIQWKDWTYSVITLLASQDSCSIVLSDIGIAEAWGYIGS
jgi:hypothetical protein